MKELFNQTFSSKETYRFEITSSVKNGREVFTAKYRRWENQILEQVTHELLDELGRVVFYTDKKILIKDINDCFDFPKLNSIS